MKSATVALQTAVSCLVASVVGIYVAHPAESIQAQNQPQKIVEAAEFKVVDKAGVARAVLGLQDNGNVRLKLNDETGNPHAAIGCGKTGDASITLLGKDQTVIGTMTVTSDGTCLLYLGSDDLGFTVNRSAKAISLGIKRGNQRVNTGCLADGSTSFTIGTEDQNAMITSNTGKTGVYLNIMETGGSSLTAGRLPANGGFGLLAMNKEAASRLVVTDEGAAVIGVQKQSTNMEAQIACLPETSFFGVQSNGKKRALLGVGPKNKTLLSLLDPNEKLRVIALVDPTADTADLTIQDAKAKNPWSLTR